MKLVTLKTKKGSALVYLAKDEGSSIKLIGQSTPVDKHEIRYTLKVGDYVAIKMFNKCRIDQIIIDRDELRIASDSLRIKADDIIAVCPEELYPRMGYGDTITPRSEESLKLYGEHLTSGIMHKHYVLLSIPYEPYAAKVRADDGTVVDVDLRHFRKVEEPDIPLTTHTPSELEVRLEEAKRVVENLTKTLELEKELETLKNRTKEVRAKLKSLKGVKL